MATNRHFLVDYLLKYPTIGEGHYLVGLSLEVVTRKFSTLVFPNYHNFVFKSNNFVRSEMGTIDSIMALKDHSTFKFVQGSRFPWQSKDKVFVLKMPVDPSRQWCGACKENANQGGGGEWGWWPKFAHGRMWVHISFPLVYELGQGNVKVHQTILAVSTPTNMQGLQKCEDNRQCRD